ncbi:hypothetical protein ACFLQ0_05450, partial [Nitrospinota bacterium]
MCKAVEQNKILEIQTVLFIRKSKIDEKGKRIIADPMGEILGGRGRGVNHYRLAQEIPIVNADDRVWS